MVHGLKKKMEMYLYFCVYDKIKHRHRPKPGRTSQTIIIRTVSLSFFPTARLPGSETTSSLTSVSVSFNTATSTSVYFPSSLPVCFRSTSKTLTVFFPSDLTRQRIQAQSSREHQLNERITFCRSLIQKQPPPNCQPFEAERSTGARQ